MIVDMPAATAVGEAVAPAVATTDSHAAWQKSSQLESSRLILADIKLADFPFDI